MKPDIRQLLVATALAVILSPLAALAQPMDFGEVSLLVRAREPESSITREISQRKLAQKLSADQEAKLKAQGASDSLIESLRTSAVASVPQTAAPTAVVADRGRPVRGERESAAADDRGYRREGKRDHVQIIDVGVGEPVNLSEWGGVDREFVFSRRSITNLQSCDFTFRPNGFTYYRDPEAELTTDELTMVEPVGSYTHYATYLGEYSRGWEPNRADFTSIMAHSFARPMRVQRHNPIHVDGVPYNLYPIYAAGGVSLYYIGRISDEVVRLAVISHWR